MRTKKLKSISKAQSIVLVQCFTNMQRVKRKTHLSLKHKEGLIDVVKHILNNKSNVRTYFPVFKILHK